LVSPIGVGLSARYQASAWQDPPGLGYLGYPGYTARGGSQTRLSALTPDWCPRLVWA